MLSMFEEKASIRTSNFAKFKKKPIALCTVLFFYGFSQHKKFLSCSPLNFRQVIATKNKCSSSSCIVQYLKRLLYVLAAHSNTLHVQRLLLLEAALVCSQLDSSLLILTALYCTKEVPVAFYAECNYCIPPPPPLPGCSHQ